MRVEVPHDSAQAKATLIQKLKDMLEKVDKCPVTRKQKLKLYRAGVCPQLTWLLSLEEFPTSWVQGNMETMATQFLKKWAGLTRSANMSILYLPRKGGGLNLPSMSTLHKCLQVLRQVQLLTSADACVRHLR